MEFPTHSDKPSFLEVKSADLPVLFFLKVVSGLLYLQNLLLPSGFSSIYLLVYLGQIELRFSHPYHLIHSIYAAYTNKCYYILSAVFVSTVTINLLCFLQTSKGIYVLDNINKRTIYYSSLSYHRIVIKLVQTESSKIDLH